jgi:hypothetical protein
MKIVVTDEERKAFMKGFPDRKRNNLVSEAALLFVEQMNSIIAKNGYLLLIASFVILFLRIGKQIAKIAIFLFVYPFRQTEGTVHPPQNK